MSHFGDPEAHRRVLHEIGAQPDSTKALAYLKAAVMGTMGSAKGALALHEIPGLMECPTRMMRIQLSLLSATVRAVKSSPRYAHECHVAVEVIQEVTKAVHEQQQQQQQQRGSYEVPINTLPGASFTSLPSSTKATSSFGARENTAAEVNEDFLYAAMAYVNYLNGFTALWSELFGPNYLIIDIHTGVPKDVPQVPPHMYAVNWQSVLSPERQAWCRGLHDRSKTLLRLIVTRAVPLEAYFLYILYAGLSLRVRLLETAAELFTWSALFVDIPYCVRQLYVSYRIQCEFARLQDVWHSCGLFDDTFVEDCKKFNLECSAAQGALFEMAPQEASATPADGVATTSFGRIRTERVRRRHPHRHHHQRYMVRDAGPSSNSQAPQSGAVAGDGEVVSADHRSDRNPHGGAPAGELASERAPSSSSRSSTQPSDSQHDASEADDNEASDADSNAADHVCEKEVYVPMFHTECRFTWILQRLFWSMYGRCTLLFSSCIKLDLAPSLSAHFWKHSDSLAVAIAGPGKVEGGDAHLSDPVGTTRSLSRPRLQQGQPQPQQQDLANQPDLSASQEERQRTAAGGDRANPSPPVTRAEPQAAQTRWTWRNVKESLARVRSPVLLRGASVGAAEGAHRSSSVPMPVPSNLRDNQPVLLPAEPQAPFYLRYTWHKTAAPGQGGREGPRPDGEAADGDPCANPATSSTDVATPEEIAAEYLAEFTFLTMGGCYVLAHAVHLALTEANYPATLIMLSDNSTRPGLRNWVNHKYVISAVADDPAERLGSESWVLNFVLPRFRLSQEPTAREAQELALLECIVGHLASADGERAMFVAPDSLFYVLNGGPYMDQGRNYLVLHMHVGNCKESAAALLEEERATAFGGLEEVRLAWYMSCSCNEALRMAAAIDAGT